MAMRPLVVDDLLPLDEYARRRREFFESHQRYVDRYRRVRIGPRLTLIFENRQTLWFRVQELLRVARLNDPARVEEELALYNRLLPGQDQLQAALVIESTGEEDHPKLAGVTGEAIAFQLGDARYPAVLVTCRPEDRAIGAAHWLQFHLDFHARRLLKDRRIPAHFEVAHGDYEHGSSPLTEEIRQSLTEDLDASDRV
jgi:Protein of unknown function (DUF3501)